MSTNFAFTDEEYSRQYSDRGILKNGLVMDEMEGIWLAWETEPEAVQALLPDTLDFIAPVVMSYIVKADTAFAGAYNEAALIVMAAHDGVPGGYLQSILLEGPGAPQAEYLGREMAGMPKKLCDAIVVENDGATAHASITKSGVTLLDCTVDLGEYNTPAGNEVFGDHIVGETVPGGLTYLIKYNLEQYPDGHMGFENGRLLTTSNDTRYETWTPGTASITLTDCPDAPWASLPVKTVLAGGFGKYSMFNFTTEKVCDIDIDRNIKALLKTRFDSRLFV